MATDFVIRITGADGEMTFEETTTIMNNVYLSLMTERGSFFQDVGFGSRLHFLLREKNTENTASLARSYCLEALQWLIDSGRATSVDVSTEIDKSQSRGLLKMLVEVVEASGRSIEFELFKEVV